MTSDVEKFVIFYESDFGERVLEKEAEYIYQELKDCQKILNIGCGIGCLEQKLSKLNIIGLDNSKKMLEEARKRSNKTFVFGNAEKLPLKNTSFDAVFYICTLEFLSDYRKAIQEAYRVTKLNGKLLVVMLNHESEYFHKHTQRKSSYFKRIKHTNLKEIREHISQHYQITKEEYFLGIKGQQIFDSSNKRLAGLYVIVGRILD